MAKDGKRSSWDICGQAVPLGRAGDQATMELLSLVFKVFACSGKWLGSDHANSSPVQASDELDVGA